VTRMGTVYLVGAGPGDPGLLTVKGAECLRQADVVVYDHLAGETLLELAPDECETICVGKRKGERTLEQDEINKLLVKLARQGKTVVRLKGGDPFVFGRGGEEALALADACVPFEIIPGVTAGVSVPAYAGIPVTHRGLSSSVVLVTGHEDPKKAAQDVNWNAIAAVDTIVVYMGRSNLAPIAESLLRAGRDANTPAAAIQWGTTSSQKTVTGNLGNIVEKCLEEQIEAPAIIVVGDVVSLRDRLSWFERKPLFGKRIVITRDRVQAEQTRRELEARGATVLEFPAIRIELLSDFTELENTIGKLSSFDWVVFTSANGVSHVFARLEERRLDARVFADVKICAIGPATAAEAKRHGILADCVPEQYMTESIADALVRFDPQIGQKRVLLLRADIAGDALDEKLRMAGADITKIAVYRIVPETEVPARAAEGLRTGEVDIVMFTSSSTVRNFARLTVQAGITVSPRVRFASIGPVTSRTAKEFGYPISWEAKEHTIPSLIDTIVSSM